MEQDTTVGSQGSRGWTHLAIISALSSVSCLVTVVLKESPLVIQYVFTVLNTDTEPTLQQPGTE